MSGFEQDLTPERSFDALVEAGAAYRQAANALSEAQQVRDAAIIVSSEQGLSRRKVADAAGVTVGRVQQVLNAMTSSTRRSLVDHIVRSTVTELPEKQRARYREEWYAELEALQDRPLMRLWYALNLARSIKALKRELINSNDSR